MNKLAVFDWNGTLIDDSLANWQACNHCLAQFGKGPITYERYRDTMDFPVLHVYTRNGIDADTYLANFQTAGLSFLDRYKELSASAPLRRGAVELFDWLLQNGYDLMVLSNFLQPELEKQMADRNVMKYFRHISGNIAFNELEHSRTTKRERLEATLSAYDPSRSFIIGDSLEEPEIARHYGLTAFSVSWGCFDPQRLKKGGTDHLIDELAQVREILQNQKIIEA